MAFFLTISAMLLMAALQAPALVVQKKWFELAAFGTAWLIATIYALLIVWEVPITPLPEFTGRLLESIYRHLGMDISLTL